PPQYNGFKAYAADGAQIIPPADKEIQQLFSNMDYKNLPSDVHALAEKPIVEEDLIEEEIYQAYLQKLRSEVFYQEGKKRIRIFYSPLHGTGGWIFQRAFHDLGYANFHAIAEQAEPDGNFPTLRSPNPEEPSAFALLLKAAENTPEKPDLLVATDPDADRVGAMVKNNGSYQFLTGNQIGCLLLESIARKKAAKLKAPYICKTIVTTELQRLIAESYGITTIETLTGFKYIAEKIARDPENYLFGGEESFGYLPVSWVRDKDSLSSAVALAELAEEQNLITALDTLYLRHGLFVELLHNIDLSREPELLQKVLGKLADPQRFAAAFDFGRRLVDILDLRSVDAVPQTTECRALKAELGKAEVVQFWLERHSRLTVRPSGTEPKIKVYLSLMAQQKPKAAELEKSKKALREETESILNRFLAAIGVAS
ncbi:MAG: phospho-sugar mutase, partial [Turneriella sp.]|nr:phospho-sugar mutase [Turneriella sp.]